MLFIYFYLSLLSLYYVKNAIIIICNNIYTINDFSSMPLTEFALSCETQIMIMIYE